MVARGANNKEIARRLGRAEAAVKIHVQHILRKLNLNSRGGGVHFVHSRPVARW